MTKTLIKTASDGAQIEYETYVKHGTAWGQYFVNGKRASYQIYGGPRTDIAAVLNRKYGLLAADKAAAEVALEAELAAYRTTLDGRVRKLRSLREMVEDTEQDLRMAREARVTAAGAGPDIGGDKIEVARQAHAAAAAEYATARAADEAATVEMERQDAEDLRAAVDAAWRS